MCLGAAIQTVLTAADYGVGPACRRNQELLWEKAFRRHEAGKHLCQHGEVRALTLPRPQSAFAPQ